MIDTFHISDYDVYNICQQHFADAGMPLKLAKDTPLELSYTWKHIQRLMSKFNEWQFSFEEIDAYIKIVARKISTLPPRSRSLKNAIKADMLEHCYVELRRSVVAANDITIELQRMHDWLYAIVAADKNVISADKNMIVEHLIRRHKPGALSNIVLYFQQGHLSKLYFAFSKPCRLALNIISNRNSAERSFCPSDVSLHYITQYRFKSQATTIRQILGE